MTAALVCIHKLVYLLLLLRKELELLLLLLLLARAVAGRVWGRGQSIPLSVETKKKQRGSKEMHVKASS